MNADQFNWSDWDSDFSPERTIYFNILSINDNYETISLLDSESEEPEQEIAG